MSPFPDLATVQECHSLYLALTGTEERTCPLTLEHQRWWEYYLVQRYTLADLMLVVKFVQAERRKHPNWSSGVLNLRRLICSIEDFREWLQQAQAAARERRAAGDPGKARVLAQSGRSEAPGAKLGQVKTPADVLPEVLKQNYEEMRKAAG